MKHLLTIDPGKIGGIAFSDGKNIIAQKMPESESDLHQTIRGFTLSAETEGADKVAVVESQAGFTQGLCGASSMFTFGKHYGYILGLLTVYRWKIELVKPQAWQKALGLGNKGKTGNANADKRAWKNKLKDHASRLNPGLEVTLATADALLLMEYARKGVV